MQGILVVPGHLILSIGTRSLFGVDSIIPLTGLWRTKNSNDWEHTPWAAQGVQGVREPLMMWWEDQKIHAWLFSGHWIIDPHTWTGELVAKQFRIPVKVHNIIAEGLGYFSQRHPRRDPHHPTTRYLVREATLFLEREGREFVIPLPKLDSPLFQVSISEARRVEGGTLLFVRIDKDVRLVPDPSDFGVRPGDPPPPPRQVWRESAWELFIPDAIAENPSLLSPTTLTLQIGSRSLDVRRDSTNRTVSLDAPPVIAGGRTFLPIRPLVETLGGSITWTEAEQRVDIVFGGTTVVLWINHPRATTNGQERLVDPNNHLVRPFIAAGRTMLPLRFIAEALGAEVQWDERTQQITIVHPRP